MSRPKPPGVPGHGPSRIPALTGTRMRKVVGGAPRVRIVPPVAKLLQDINAVAGRELAKLAAAQAASKVPTPGLARELDALSSAVARAHKTEQEVMRELGDATQDLDDDELAALAADLGVEHD